jgi:hypothetical protein
MTHRKATPNCVFSAPIFVEIKTLLDTTCDDPWRPPYKQCLWTVYGGPKKGGGRCGNRLGKKDEDRLSKLVADLIDMAACPPSDDFYNNVKYYLENTHCSEHNHHVVDKFHRWKADRLSPALISVRPTRLNGGRSRQMSAEDCTSEYVSMKLRLRKQRPGVSNLYRPTTPTMSDDSGPETEDDASSDSSYAPSGYSTESGENESTPATSPEATPMKEKGKIIDRTYDVSGKSRLKKSASVEESGADNHTLAYPFTVTDPASRRVNHLISPMISSIVDIMESGFNPSKIGKVYVLSHKSYPGLYKVGYTSQKTRKRIGDDLCNRVGAKKIYETEEFRGARKVELLVHHSFKHKRLPINSCGYCNANHTEWFDVGEEDAVSCVKAWMAYVKSPVYNEGCRTDQYDVFSAALIDLSPERILRTIQASFPLVATAEQTHNSGQVQPVEDGMRASPGNGAGLRLQTGGAGCSDTTKEANAKKAGKQPPAGKEKGRSSNTDGSKEFPLQRRPSAIAQASSEFMERLVKATEATKLAIAIRARPARGKKKSAAGDTTGRV